MLATYWWPNLNPIGPASLWPLGIVIAYVYIVWVTQSRAALFCGPAALTAGALFCGQVPHDSPWLGGFGLLCTRWPDAVDFVGYYIWSLATAAFAFEIARSGSRIACVYGGLVLFPLGGLLTLEAVDRSTDFISATRGLHDRVVLLLAAAVWVPLYAVLMVRAVLAARRTYRREHGLCVNCGYDLTGNVSGRCPECGTAIVSRAG